MASIFNQSTERNPSEAAGDAKVSLAKTLAPEEVRPRDFVTILDEISELPSFLWVGDSVARAQDEIVRIKHLSSTGGVPLRVKSVCLPFVLVRHPNGHQQALDVRKVRLARLGPHYAKSAWRAMKHLSEPAMR